MKTMAEALEQHAVWGYNGSEIACECNRRNWISARGFSAHQADALTAAGFGPVKAARAEALRQSAAIGWDAAVSAMTYEDGTPVEVAKNSNPYRTEVGDDAHD